MGNLVDLIHECLFVFAVIVAKCHNADPGCKIQIFLAIRIIDMHAFSLFKYDRETIVDMEQRFFCCSNIFFFIHD